MEKRLSFFLSTVLFSQCQLQGILAVQVVIDGYTHNSILSSGDSVPLGRQFILVCWVVGLPYGTPLNYTWTCPNGSCEVEGYHGRKVCNEHILAVNTTATSDGGTYTCQVTATGGQEATGNFSLTVTGGRVVHSYGRLIPHEFPITDLQQISGPDGIGRITCTVSSGTASFVTVPRKLHSVEVTLRGNGNSPTSTLVVNTNNAASFKNRDMYCNDDDYYFYLFLSSKDSLVAPNMMVITANEAVEYKVEGRIRIIVGHEVIRFRVPMVERYENAGTGQPGRRQRTITISPAVPGAQYRITAWTIGFANNNFRRSAISAMGYAKTEEKIPSAPRALSITSIIEAGIELNWLPPTEPNGEVHYVIYYTPEGGQQELNDTGSNLTHYNLTGLERNKVYTNIAVEAVNSAGRSDRSAVITQYNHTPPVPSLPMEVNITRVFQDGIELNWLPPTEPNGEVHYVIYYTPEGGTEQSIDTGSNLTHYNLTGLERNRVYTNIAVEAVNSIGRSGRSAVIEHYNHTPPAIATSTDPIAPMSQWNAADNTLFIVVGVAASAIALLVLLAVVVLVVIAVRRMKSRKEVEPVNYHQEHTPHVGEHPGGDNLYQNTDKMPEVQHHTSADISGHNEVDDTFTSAASARAPLGISTHDGVQYSKIDQGPTGHQGGGGYEVEGMYEQPERSSAALAVMGVQRAQKETAGSAQSQSVSKAENLNELYAQPDKSRKTQKKKAGDTDEGLNTTPGPDQLYAQPDKTKKGGKKQSEQKQPRPVTDPEQLYTQPNKARAATGKHPVGEDAEAEPNKTKKTKKDSQVTRSEEAADPSDDMYAKPDMTKKGDRKSQLPPQAPLPYKNHKEAKHKGEWDGDAAPELPPPYIPNDERYYNTRGGAGPPNQEGNYDYATVDWHP